MNMRYKKTPVLFFCLFMLVVGHPSPALARKKPRLTVIMVVDQLSYNEFQKYTPYLRYGLKHLLSRGINYINAYQPHAIPETAPGHAGLSTGTYPKDHGIIGNTWFDEKGNLIRACDDTPDAAILNSTEKDVPGVSSKLLLVDTISDQFVLQSVPGHRHYAYALSFKDYAAVQLAGKLGKAIWFDAKTGNFTSSKAYFETLPGWITQFNGMNFMRNRTSIFWQQAKPATSNAYIFAYDQQFNAAEFKEGLVNTEIPIDWESEKPFNFFTKTPHANKLLLDLAQNCIDEHVTKKNKDHLLLWISLSPLDKAGHAFGPDSKEKIDIIYHLDKQLSRFIRHAQKTVGKEEILFVLTADHGIAPMVATIAQKGYPALRYSNDQLIHTINADLEKAGHKAGLLKQYNYQQLYLDNKFAALSAPEQNKLLQDTKQTLLKQPGVKRVWTYQELAHTNFEAHDLGNNFKNQLYPGRSGQLIIQLNPYCEVNEWKTGAEHSAPYDYNTHVPLILYQHGAIELEKIGQRVSTLQLANTLADILHIPKPSASTFECLPGIHGRMPLLLF